MTIGEFLIFINLIASFTTAVFPLFYHVYQKKGIKKKSYFLELFLNSLILKKKIFSTIISLKCLSLHISFSHIFHEF